MDFEHVAARGRLAWRALSWAAFITATVAATLATTAAAFAAGVPEDRDSRAGTVQPTAAQEQIVSGLGATATWNDFGTPASLTKDGGYLATGVAGKDAATAARNWIAANKSLFRLGSVDGLKLESDHSFGGSDAWVVTFRQYFGGLPVRPDGTLTVGMSGTPAGGWKIASISSGVTGSSGLAAQSALSAPAAWASAAGDVGYSSSVVNVKSVKESGDWKQFAVPGFTEPQRARLVAVPTPTNGVRPAWETVVVNEAGGEMRGYLSFVDAVTGAVLVRTNIVEHSHPPADVFNGNFQPGDAAGPAACDTPKGPWVVAAGESVESIVVTVAAVNPANDAVIRLLLNGVEVAQQDLLTSPEVLNYDPPGSVPTGSYTVQICDFEDNADPLPPTNYSGSIVFNEQDTSGGSPVNPPYIARWKVFPNSPLLGTLAQDPWNIPDTDIRKVWCWDATGPAPTFTPIPGCDTVAAGKSDVQNLASRVPWDVLPPAGPTFTTIGNNAFSREAWISPLTPGGAFQPFGVPPVTSGVRDYSFPWTNQWEAQDCNPATTFPSAQRNDIDAAVTNLFAMHNRLHDWDYFLGFTEENWNAQFHNFFGGGAEHDPVQGDAQAGGLTGGAPSYLGRDNANMVTTPDGAPPVTNMYLWQPLAGAFYAPCVDGDYDMGVIGHEYGHLTENRMIGKGGTRGGHHAGAMGESFGDFHATEYLNEYGYATVVPGQNPFALGAYATGDRIQGIRNYPGNFAPTGAFPTAGVNPAINPLQFGNMGYDLTGPQVHADGEIWTKLNFRLREALRLKYDAAFPSSNQALQVECADGKRPANICPGNRRWIQLYFAAMLTMPTAPSMLQARDHIIAADQMLFGGANQTELWNEFARYGFGQFAASTNGTADTDTDPAPDHMSPVHNEATVTFTSAATSGTPARVYVGHYEARTSPIADTDPATNNGAAGANGNNLDNVARFVPGTYEFVAKANGFGHIRFRLTLTAGQTLTFALPFVRNWASSSSGATAQQGVGVWNELGNLIDDTEATNADWGPGTLKVDTVNPSIIVNLGGTTPRSVREVKVSAMLHAGGGNRFTALRSFQILTCNGSDAVCSVPTNFTVRPIVGGGNINAFPGTTPRPTAPELILRNFVLTSTVNATHVMIRVLDNQCTGNPAFQGDQDADGLNNSDCETGSPGTATPFGDLDVVLAERDDEVHIAELQVFSTTSGTGGGGGGGNGGGGGGGDDGDDECEGDDDVVKLGPAVASPGSTVQYTITYTNTGDRDDVDCEIDDLMSDDLTYVSSTGGGVYDLATRIVSWNSGAVAAGAARTVTLTARVSSSATVGSTIVNRAYFGALGLDASPLGTATTLVVTP